MCRSTYLKTVQGMLKPIELVFVIISLGVYRGANLVFGGDHEVAVDTLFAGMLISALIVTSCLLICYLVEQTPYLQQTFLESLLSFIMFGGLAAVGSLVLEDVIQKEIKDKKAAECYAMACSSLMASVAYLVDFIFSIIKYKS